MPSIHSVEINGGSDPLLATVHDRYDSDVDDGPRLCRICLDEEEESSNNNGHESESCHFIAPCTCRGTQRWVHRDCLDEWRATNSKRIAFSKCNECSTDYRLVYAGPNAGRGAYWCYVTRDIGIGCVMIQIIMITCGYLLWLCASSANEFGNQTMAGITINTSSWSQVLLADCVSGLCIVLLLLGVFGFVLLCKHECSLKETLAELEETTELGHASMLSGSSGGTRDLGAPIGQNRQSLDRGLDHGAGRRHRDLHGPPPTPMDCTGCYSRSDGCCNRSVDCCCMPTNCYYIDCNSCNYCCSDVCRSCSCNGCGGPGDCGGGGGSPMAHFVLAVVGVVLAGIGLVVGVFFSCFLVQRILQHHLFRLHKKRLTQSYVVQDLYPRRSGSDDLEASAAIPPPIPVELPSAIPSPTDSSNLGSKGCKQVNGEEQLPHSEYLLELGLLE